MQAGEVRLLSRRSFEHGEGSASLRLPKKSKACDTPREQNMETRSQTNREEVERQTPAFGRGDGNARLDDIEVYR
jgi:hypothetical protein